MSQAPDSLKETWPTPQSGGPASPMTEPQPQPQPQAPEGGEVTPPQFDRVAEVLGPLEQVVLAADQRLGTIQQQVSTQAGEEAAHVERRVREAAAAQRQRIADLKQHLTARKSDISARFDAMLNLIDEVDRDLALRAGPAQVTLTERQTVQIAHDVPQAPGFATAPATQVPPAPGQAPVAAAQPPAVPAAGQAPAGAEAQKQGRFSRWFRRKRSSN